MNKKLSKKEKFNAWIKKAKPWHFWNPGSGPLGGVIAALIISFILCFLFLR